MELLLRKGNQALEGEPKIASTREALSQFSCLLAYAVNVCSSPERHPIHQPIFRQELGTSQGGEMGPVHGKQSLLVLLRA